MTRNQKINRTKVGFLELAKQLDNERRRPVPVEAHIREKSLQTAIRRRDQSGPEKLAGYVAQLDRAAVDYTQYQQRQRLKTRLAEIKMAR